MSQFSSMGNNEEDACKLGLGVGEQYCAASSTLMKDDHDHHGKKIKETLIPSRLDLCRYEFCPKVDHYHDHDHTDHTISSGGNSNSKTNNDIQDDHDQEDHAGKCGSRKNENSNIVINGGNGRKKLKLTEEQTTILECCFKFNTTLNLAQKRELAGQLNLKPRQVEVWFQNKRARTKMKQTEEDCELLKKCCESLGQENKRLKQELQKLRSIKVEHPRRELQDHIRFAKNAKITLCPYCRKTSKLDDNITN